MIKEAKLLNSFNAAFHIGRGPSRVRLHRTLNNFLLFVIFWMISAASFSGYISKWGLRDGELRNGIEVMLDGTAHKPFVYRQLAPAIANFADDNLPDTVKEIVVERHKLANPYSNSAAYSQEGFRFRYLIICYCSFLALLGSAFVLREALKTLGVNSSISTAAPALLIIALPYLQTEGGYFYDFFELLFLSLAFLFALKGKIYALLLIVIPATLNKESFLLFLPSLYPILRMHYSLRKSLITLVGAMGISGLLYLFVKDMYAANPGSSIERHLWGNIINYLTPWFYRRWEITYGLISPSGMSFISLAVLSSIVWRGWGTCDNTIQRHVLIAAAINLPMFLIFAATGELRNLSLLFVGMTIILAHALEQSVWANACKNQSAV